MHDFVHISKENGNLDINKVKKLEISNKIIKKYIHCRCNKARYSICSDLKSYLLAYKCMQYKPIQNHKRVTAHLKMHSFNFLKEKFSVLIAQNKPS